MFMEETAALAANMVTRTMPGGPGGGMDAEMNLDEYGIYIGYMVAEAFVGKGFSYQNLGKLDDFWNDMLSKNPYPVCVAYLGDFGTYKATPIDMSENLAAFKMEAVYEVYRLSIDTIIYKEPTAGQTNVFVYVTTSPLMPQEG